MKILYFAPIDWDFIRQRPQHIAQRLAEYHDFFYIQPLGLRNLQLSDTSRALKRLSRFLKRQVPQEKLHIKNLFFIPFINRYIQKINLYFLKKQIESLTDDETIIWVTSPPSFIPLLLGRLRFKALVYEMMDDYAKIHLSREKDVLETETWLINNASLIITTSFSLCEKVKKINKDKDVFLVGNGVDYQYFNETTFKKPPELEGMNSIVGYVGTIDSWIDFETITFIADRRKDIDFVFVGPSKIKDLPVRENIHFLGKRDYETVPHYCNFFDVCLIPFREGEFADTINPVKLYEYFALGKPTVSYNMKELKAFNELIYLAKDKEDFLEKIGFALLENDPVKRLERKESARQNDWSTKINLLNEALLRVS